MACREFRFFLVYVLLISSFRSASSRNSRRRRKKNEDPEKNSDIDRIIQAYEKNDLYLMLGVSASCSADQLKDAFREASLSVHPDKTRDHRAESAFDMIRDAYELLSEPMDRAEYDRIRNERILREKQIAVERRQSRLRKIRKPFQLASFGIKQLWRYKLLVFLAWVLFKTLQA